MRATGHLGPLLMCLAVAAAMMSPLLGGRLVVSPADDAAVHISGVIEARNALAEGQFPVRVAPSHDGGYGGTDIGQVRVPLFQFYGNFPYTLGGLLYAGTADPYTAWKLVQFGALAAGGFYTYLAARRATRRPRVAALAGLVFMTAPYVWCDLHARFAFTELVSFGLLPVAFYYADRAFASPRKRYIILSGVAWALLALSHNVAYLYASAYFGVYFLSRLRIRRASRGQEPLQRPRLLKSVRRLARVGFGYALGVVLVLWYLVPQLTVLEVLNIRYASGLGIPVGAELLTSLDILLAPSMKVPAVSNTPNLGLQVGWVILGAALLAVAALAAPGNRRRRATLRLVVFFVVALFMTWSPVNFWQYLPKVLAYVQSTYRILMFVVLFGSLLAAYGLAATLARRRDLGWPATLVLAAVIAAAAWSYVPRHETRSPRALAALVQKPAVSGNRDYLVAGQAAAQTTWTHPSINWAEPIRGVFPPFARFTGRYFMLVRVPRDAGATTAEIAGHIPSPHGKPAQLEIVLDDKVLFAGPAGPGDFSLTVPIPGPMSADATWLVFNANFPDNLGPAEIVMRSLRFIPAAAPELPFIPASQSMADTRTERGRTEYHRGGPGPAALVELPLMYYPELLRVRRGGEDVPYGNVGRLLGVRVPEGPYRVKVTFVGVPWANVVSGVGWVGLVVLPIAVWGVARIRAIRLPRVRIPRGVRPALGWTALAALPFAILAARPIHHYATLETFKPFPCTATASRGADSPERDDPAYAFDGDDGTTWDVHNGATPATLTIVPKTPAKFSHISLLARESGLWETWHTVHVELLDGGKPVLSQTFELPNADKKPLQDIRFAPTHADKIVLTFSNAVTVTRDGQTRVDAAATSPGYREIRIE